MTEYRNLRVGETPKGETKLFMDKRGLLKSQERKKLGYYKSVAQASSLGNTAAFFNNSSLVGDDSLSENPLDGIIQDDYHEADDCLLMRELERLKKGK